MWWCWGKLSRPNPHKTIAKCHFSRSESRVQQCDVRRPPQHVWYWLAQSIAVAVAQNLASDHAERMMMNISLSSALPSCGDRATGWGQILSVRLARVGFRTNIYLVQVQYMFFSSVLGNGTWMRNIFQCIQAEFKTFTTPLKLNFEHTVAEISDSVHQINHFPLHTNLHL